jgi:hypothetical protein
MVFHPSTLTYWRRRLVASSHPTGRTISAGTMAEAPIAPLRKFRPTSIAPIWLSWLAYNTGEVDVSVYVSGALCSAEAAVQRAVLAA